MKKKRDSLKDSGLILFGPKYIDCINCGLIVVLYFRYRIYRSSVVEARMCLTNLKFDINSEINLPYMCCKSITSSPELQKFYL